MSLKFPEQIETERLILRRLRPVDAERIFYVYGSKPEATKYVVWPTHQSLEDARTFLRYSELGWKKGIEFSYGIFLRKSERMIGSIAVILKDLNAVQLGYILGPIHWHFGYATEACKSFIKTIQSTKSVTRIDSFVDIENTASANVLLKSGFCEDTLSKMTIRFVNQNNQMKDCRLFYLLL
jgi:ribosomal-protein-alanine N-acetyltransferase